MKKTFLFAVITVFASCIFTSCDNNEPKNKDNPKNDNEKTTLTLSGSLKYIEGTSDDYVIKDVTDQIDEIRVSVSYGEKHSKDTVFAKTTVSNGKFSITLPTPGDELLSLLFTGNESETIIISDKNAKGLFVYPSEEFDAYKNDEMISHVFRLSLKGSSQESATSYIYSDRDFTMTGQHGSDETIFYKYNLSFKKGWNTFVLKGKKEGNTSVQEYSSENEPSNTMWLVNLNK